MTDRAAHQPKGAAAVGRISDYDPLSVAAITYLRMWCESPDTQHAMMEELVDTLGAARGHRAIEAMSDLCSLCVKHGRRPFCRHGLHCSCVGADEACFAQLVSEAVDGDREDAMLIAILMVRPDLAPMAASHAARFGVALRQMSLKVPRASPPQYSGRRMLH